MKLETANMDASEINELADACVTWDSRGVIDVEISDQESGFVTRHQIDEDQNQVLRRLCAEAINNPEQHGWLQSSIGQLMGTAAASILAVTSGNKLDAIERFAAAR